MTPVQSLDARTGGLPDKPYKATLFGSPRLFLGLNCLEPGQIQARHAHAHQDKFYAVHRGRGRFTVGARSFEAGPGEVVWAQAGEEHGVENPGPERLVLLVGMAPGLDR
jgi:mannose-6-phosphate isomerase-like protein (cupin superfamily)